MKREGILNQKLANLFRQLSWGGGFGWWVYFLAWAQIGVGFLRHWTLGSVLPLAMVLVLISFSMAPSGRVPPGHVLGHKRRELLVYPPPAKRPGHRLNNSCKQLKHKSEKYTLIKKIAECWSTNVESWCIYQKHSWTGRRRELKHSYTETGTMSLW